MYDKHKSIRILGKEYEKAMDKVKRKTYGSFYTPDYIVDYIIENTLSNLNLVDNPFVKILDPSCGVGYFLIKAYDVLKSKFSDNIELIRKKYLKEEYSISVNGKLKKLTGEDYWKKKNLHYHILKYCIYGADIDDEAVQITKANLLSKGVYDLDLSDNIVCCDSLIRWEEDYCFENEEIFTSGKFLCKYRDINFKSTEKYLNRDELLELRNIRNFWAKKYDYIIGNPPWVSLNRKYKKDIDDNLLNYYITKYDGNKYLPNLYEFFLKRAIGLIKNTGRVGFIIPDRFAKNLQYKLLRKELLASYKIVHLAFQVNFPEINTDTMILILEKDYEENSKISINIFNKRQYDIYQKEYLSTEDYEFIYESNSDYKLIKEKVENKSVTLGDISTTFTGFIGDSKKISTEKVTSKQVEILKGENINRFNIISRYYYEFIPENLKGGTKNIKKLACPLKIVVRKTGNKIIAALDTEGYIIEQSLYGIINLREGFSYKYVLAVLNSRLTEWYYSNFLITNINSTPQIKKYGLDRLPIKCCSKEKQTTIEGLVDKISAKAKKLINEKAANKNDSNMEDKKQLKELQRKLNYEIFSLYELEYEDINKISIDY